SSKKKKNQNFSLSMDEERLKKAKSTLKDLLSHHPGTDDESGPSCNSWWCLPSFGNCRGDSDDVSQKDKGEAIPLNTPFKMFFVHEDGDMKKAAVIPEHVVNSLTEKDVEAHQMTQQFQDSTKQNKSLKGAAPLQVLKGECVLFERTKLHNVDGSSKDDRVKSWIEFWKHSYGISHPPPCYIETPGQHSNPSIPPVGGHVQTLWLNDDYWYILPICYAHNAKTYDPNGTVMITHKKAYAVKIPPV
uniref:Uncharacterized protein n=1 Tax=Clytia hemisphaerica TaxID=252671 RepID=A0A7M5XEJ4_9CNID